MVHYIFLTQFGIKPYICLLNGSFIAKD